MKRLYFSSEEQHAYLTRMPPELQLSQPPPPLFLLAGACFLNRLDNRRLDPHRAEDAILLARQRSTLVLLPRHRPGCRVTRLLQLQLQDALPQVADVGCRVRQRCLQRVHVGISSR